MSVSKWFVTASIAAAAVAATPRTASADWTLTPFIGGNFSGSADVTGNGGSSVPNQFEKKLDYGVSLTGMGAGALGVEFDFGYSPNFFETGTASNNSFQLTNDSNVVTLTGNAIIGVPIGGHGASVRPYVVGGVGLIRSNVGTAGDLFDVRTKNDFGFDLGGGAMAFFTQNIGIRGDVRYFRSFQGSSSDSLTGLALSNFHFWRGSLGLAIKF
jgi:opacity protein-like surface antigen